MTQTAKKSKGILLISVQENLSVMGLKSIHYFLLKNGHQSYLLHLPYFNPANFHALECLGRFVAQINPCFIGLSLMSTEYYRACAVSRYLKKNFPTTPVIWGGTHPTIAPETCFPLADYACIGEGEKTALDLANAFVEGHDIKNIPNLCYRDGESFRKNPLYPLIDDLDELPSLDHISVNSFLQKSNSEICLIDKKVFKKKARYLGKKYELITSRGCAFSCTYCCNNFLHKLYEIKKIRRRGVENIIIELEKAIKNNPEISLIHIQDDSFMSCNEEYLARFCELYNDRIKKPFIIHSIPINVNTDNIRCLKRAGLAWINLGLQSGSDHTCRDIYKRRSLKKDFLKAAELVKRFKIAGKYDVILDNPFENEEDKIETIEALIKTPRPFLVEFFSLTFYPGTELYEKAVTVYPEILKEYRRKDRAQYKCNTLNKITALAACLPEASMRKVLQLYKTSPGGLIFRTALFIFTAISKIYYKPITYANMLKLAHAGSYIKAARNLPMYINDAFAKKL